MPVLARSRQLLRRAPQCSAHGTAEEPSQLRFKQQSHRETRSECISTVPGAAPIEFVPQSDPSHPEIGTKTREALKAFAMQT